MRHYARRTAGTYEQWVRRFLRFHGDAPPGTLAEAEVREYLEYLAVARNVSASTQNQALSALLFLYQTVLELPLGELGDVVRARRPQRLPGLPAGLSSILSSPGRKSEGGERLTKEAGQRGTSPSRVRRE